MIGWALAAAMLVLVLGLGIILSFHWFRYAMNPAATTLALLVYIGVSVFLLIGMVTSLALFLPSL